MRFTTLVLSALPLLAHARSRHHVTAQHLAHRTNANTTNPLPALPLPPTSAYKKSLHQLKLRIKYPEFFQASRTQAGKRDDPAPSHEVCVDVCPAFPGEFIDCNWVPGPAEKKKRSENDEEMEEESKFVMLSPETAARFFLGRGAFTNENGTHVADTHYLESGEHRRAMQVKRGSRFSTWVRSVLGNMVMDLGIPIYKRWKDHYASQPDYQFALSQTHAFYMGDLTKIERALLDTPGWDEFEVGEWRVSRKFLELAHSL